MVNVKHYSTFLFILVLIIIGAGLSAQNIDLQSLSTGEQEKLFTNEVLIKVYKDRKDISFLPQCNFTEKVDTILKQIDPNILVETMVLLPFSIKEADIQVESYNILRSVSKLTEAKYYSEKKNDTHSIFHKSYRVESSKDLDPLPDSLLISIPDNESMLIYQSPASLIEVLSRVEYFSVQDQICMTIENLTDIRFHFLKIFRLVKPGNMSTIVLLLPYGDSTLLYVLGSADAFKIFGIGADKTENLIYNRTIGMINYYISRLSEIGK